MKHATSKELRSDYPVPVDLVGCGGTGSQMLNHLLNLHLALRSRNRPGLCVRVFDPDTVSAANIGRQRFYAGDRGRNKAVVSVNRINIACNVEFEAYPEQYRHLMSAAVVISCVDSRRSRRDIIRCCGQSAPAYHLDCGNGADFGQVAIGNGKEIAWPQQRFPELFDPRLDSVADGPSCILAEALEKQNLYVNVFAAALAAQLLESLFLEGGLDYAGAVFNLKSFKTVPLPIVSAAEAKQRQKENPEK